jgi:hypothetical protein
MLYEVLFILDRRAKLHAFGNFLALLSDTLNLDYYDYFTNVYDKLSKIYGNYDQKYA